MSDEKPKTSLQTPLPPIDRSKWTANVPLAKPVDPRDVIEAARAIRAEPDLWAIFIRLQPDEWISEEDGQKLSSFRQAYFDRIGRGPSVRTDGQEMGLLRALKEGRVANLDDDAALLSYMKQTRGRPE